MWPTIVCPDLFFSLLQFRIYVKSPWTSFKKDEHSKAVTSHEVFQLDKTSRGTCIPRGIFNLQYDEMCHFLRVYTVLFIISAFIA